MTVQAGDILLYTDHPDWIDRGIQFFEELEDGKHKFMPYHVALALDSTTQIAAYRKVEIVPIGYDGPDYLVYRPPISPRRREKGLELVKEFNGQSYDYLAIFDDALRYATRNLIHLPVSWIQSTERHMKVCSSLVADYFNEAMFPGDWTHHTSPLDVYLAVKDYRVF